MNGLEISKQFYLNTQGQIFSGDLAALKKRAAIGLVGEGSDCYGYDDEISRDHDWGPGYCIWLANDDYDKFGQQLAFKYQNLKKECCGYKRIDTPEGMGRVGVFRTSDFYRKYTGFKNGPQAILEWRKVPEFALSVATNGQVFFDGLGEFTKVRTHLLEYYPNDVVLKKMIARMATMAQAGQYNFPRCIKRNDLFAARMALDEFIKATASFMYLINKKYMPYYKWVYRGIQDLPILSECVSDIMKLITRIEPENVDIIESICSKVILYLKEKGLTNTDEDFLIPHCKLIMDKIQHEDIRKLHIMQE